MSSMKEIHLVTVIAVVLFMLVMLWLLPGCSKEPAAGNAATPATTPPLPATAPHGLDPELVTHGGGIYKANCAVCHGANAEGAPNWQKPGVDGKYPAPPLNGTGHAWHHPKAALKATIKRGTVPMGGSMPAWEGKLSDDDIEAVVAWIQSRWPDEIYRSWLAMDEKARRGAGKQ
jgi:mono/diheme cytochrome c family protein